MFFKYEPGVPLDEPPPRPDRVNGNIDAYPASAQIVRGLDCRRTPAEGVEHGIAGIARRLDNARQERQWLLRCVAEALPCEIVNRANVSPYVLQWKAGWSSR